MGNADCLFGRRVRLGVMRISNNFPGREQLFRVCVPGPRSPFENIGKVYITAGNCDIGCADGNHRFAHWNARFPGESQSHAQRSLK